MKHDQYILSDSGKLLATIHMLPQLFTCIMVKAVALFPTRNSSTYLYVTKLLHHAGRDERGQEGAIPRAPNHYGERRMTAGCAKNFQQCYRYFLQNSKIRFHKTSDANMGRIDPGAM